MTVILTGRNEMFARWALPRIKHFGSPTEFMKDGRYVAVGVATGNSKQDKLLAVVMYHDYQPQFAHCAISIASADPRWASKKTLRSLLSIPFYQYKCNKVWVAVPHDHLRTLKLAKVLGFTREATLRDHFGRGVHAVILRMMIGDYNRIYWSKPEGALPSEAA